MKQNLFREEKCAVLIHFTICGRKDCQCFKSGFVSMQIKGNQAVFFICFINIIFLLVAVSVFRAITLSCLNLSYFLCPFQEGWYWMSLCWKAEEGCRLVCVCLCETQRARLALVVVRAGQRGMDDWRRTGTCGGGDARRRRTRGRLQLRQWRLGSPGCLGWEGRERRSAPPDTYVQSHHKHEWATRDKRTQKDARSSIPITHRAGLV